MIKARIVCVLIILGVAQSDADNFDTFEPIMRFSPEFNGTDRDLFGYTLVLHQLDNAGGVDNTR